MNLQELLNDCLYGKKKKKKSTLKDDANIPTPQDFGGLSLAKRVVKSKRQEVKKTREVKKAKEDITESKLTDELSKRLAWKYYWWVKKGDNYGLATFAAHAEKMAEAPTQGRSKDVPQMKQTGSYIPLYQKPLLISWLVTNKEVKASGKDDFFDYIKSKELPMWLLMSKNALKMIMSEVDNFIKRNIGDKDISEYTPEERNKIIELEEQTVAAMRELPIKLDNKQLTPAETNKIKQLFMSGVKTSGKYWSVNVPKVFKEKDLPEVQKMAKKALG